MHPFVRRVLVLAATAACLGTLACGACGTEESEKPAASTKAPDEPTAPGAVPAPASPDEPLRYSMETDEGEHFEAQIGDDVGLPRDFPSDVPRYPGAHATAAVSVGAGGMVVRMETLDDQEVVYSYVRDNLEGQGWDIANEAMFQGQRLIEATKGDRKASIAVQAVEGTTQVNIALMESQ